jgi:hypothetical protein
MSRNRSVVACAMLATLLALQSGASAPERFEGSWSLSVVATSGFPWWHEIKYPVRLEIFEGRLRFWDQSGCECVVERPLYDEELGALIVPHCSETKSSNAFRPFYKFSLRKATLFGEVWTYKRLFSIRGTRDAAEATQPDTEGHD